MEHIKGTVQSIRFGPTADGFCIANIRTKNVSNDDAFQDEVITVKGNIPGVRIGDDYILHGETKDLS